MGIIAPQKRAGAVGVRVACPQGEAQTPSTSHDTEVCVEVTAKAATTTKIRILCQGQVIANNEIPAAVATQTEVPFSFVCPAGASFILETNAGIKEAFMTLTPLN